MELLLDTLQPCLQVVQSNIVTWSAKRPALALSTVILFCVILLPFITATALMPIVFLLDLGTFISTKGVLYFVYTVLYQGLVLGSLLVVLFFAAFAIATVASVMHSYTNFYSKVKN